MSISFSSLVSVFVALESTFFEFDLGACQNLRVFEARIETSSYALYDLMVWLARVISTIKSPAFSKFILSLDHTTFEPHILGLNAATTNILDQWMSWLSSRSGARFIIKGDLPLVWRQLLVLCFPFCTDRNAIRFDFGDQGTVPQCG